MVKLKIEMSMADLIAKVAKKQERLPPCQDQSSSGRSRGMMTSGGRSSGMASGIRSLASRSINSSQTQSHPPSRNAVPFRVWQGLEDVHRTDPAATVGLDSRGDPPPSSPGVLTGESAWVSMPEGRNDAPGSSTELYRVREVTVQSEAAHRTGTARTDNGICLEVLNENDSRDNQASGETDDTALAQGNQSQAVWDGDHTVSTAVHAELRADT